MKRKFLLCRRCGNLIEMINDSGVTPICCGTDMNELTPNSVEAATEKHIPVVEIDGNIARVTVGSTLHPMVEAATEKHIPVVEIDGNIAKVTVGSTLHPMEEAHYIEWIYLETSIGIKRVKLNPKEEPIASFALLEEETVVAAYAYCNLHGLWIKELK